MKSHYFLIYAFTALIFTSCSSSKFYQVYKTTPGAALSQADNALVYEDENCRILYNLWGDGGNIGFQFYNKTSQPIFLNMEESFFIKNQVAHDYYLDRVVTHTYNSGSMIASFSNPLSVSSGESVAYHEEKKVIVPPMTSKIINEYAITQDLVRNCDLFLYPQKRQIKKVSYDEGSTPIKFSNRISYSVGEAQESVKVENSFYVTEVANYPESEYMEKEYEDNCGEKSMLPTAYFKEAKPNMFYISYTKKPEDNQKH